MHWPAYLTPVAEALLKGYSDPEIARECGLSRKCVKNYLQSMKIRLGLDDWGIVRVRLAVHIHGMRKQLGVRCQGCGEL